MSKKARRQMRNAIVATKNFGQWLPIASKHFFEELPPATHRLKSWFTTFRGALTLVCLAGLFAFPFISRSDYYLGIFVAANIMVIYAASWDLLSGFTGQVSFGHAIFLGMGGYIAAASVRYFGQPWWLSVLAGAVAAVLIGLVIGIPCLRLKGPYLALGTLAFSLVLYRLFSSGALAPIFGGEMGVSGVPPLSYDPAVRYLVNLIITIVSIAVMVAIVNSRVGTVFKAIRDDETSAEASGINTTKYKLVAYMISGFFAGIAGSLLALENRAVGPANYSTLYSFQAIVIAAIGGIASITGSIGGAYLYTFLTRFLTSFAELSLLVFAVILIIIIRFASGGFMKPLLERLKEFINVLRGK